MNKKPLVCYSTATRIGGQGLALVAKMAGEAMQENSMLEQLVCYGSKDKEHIARINRLYFQPAKLLSFLPSKYYYSMKREWLDIRTTQILKYSSANIFHGWTHEAYRSLLVAKKRGMLTILERGNPHPNYVKKVHDQEANFYKRKSNFDYKNENLFLKRFNHCRYEMEEAIEEIELADYIFVNSNFCAQTFIENNVDSSKVIVIPRGYSPSNFKLRPKQKHNEKFILLFVGQLMMRKGIKYLIDAWVDLNLENAELWFVGGITNEIISIIQDQKKLKNIKFIGHVQNPAPYFLKASAFILPSLDEGSAKVTYEAMATGLPCIFTENTGSVATKDTAIIIPIKSKEAIKSSILNLYNDVEYRNFLGDKGYKLIKKYTWDHYKNNLVRQYKHLLNKS
jgi:glycosyltransferase involved in cell wall biosynthesis